MRTLSLSKLIKKIFKKEKKSHGNVLCPTGKPDRVIQSPLDEARVQHGLRGDNFNGVMKTEAHVCGLLQQKETSNLYSFFKKVHLK